MTGDEPQPAIDLGELVRIVREEGLEPPVLYGAGDLHDEAVVLERDDAGWTVYVSDAQGRPIPATVRRFEGEPEALAHVLRKARETTKYHRSLAARGLGLPPLPGAARPGACAVCSAFWVTGVGRPETLGTSEEFMAEIRRCRNCGAYWEVGAFSNPVVISPEQARRELPDLDARERALGIDFPDPPPVG